MTLDNATPDKAEKDNICAYTARAVNSLSKDSSCYTSIDLFCSTEDLSAWCRDLNQIN